MSKPLSFTGSLSPKACSRLASPSTRLLLDLSLWHALAVAGERFSAPLRQFLAYQLLLGRSVATVVSDLQRLLLWAVGWLAAPPRSRTLLSVGGDLLTVRRYHFTLGEEPCRAPVFKLVPPLSREAFFTRVILPITAGLALAATVRLAYRKLRDTFDETARKKVAAQRRMDGAVNYSAWCKAATELDGLEGLSRPEQLAKWKRETRLYDRKLLNQRLKHLREVRERGDVAEMMFAVRADLLRNLGNMCNR